MSPPQLPQLPPFPTWRPRRLRRTPALRRLVSEIALRPADLVLPMFVREGIDRARAIASMPGVLQHTQESLVKAAVEAVDSRRRRPDDLRCAERRAQGRDRQLRADDPQGVLNVALRSLRAELGDATVLMADLCLDEFTDHGHCGVLDEHGGVDNDATLFRYSAMGLAQAEAGAHLLGTSGMMDGQVGAVRQALDAAGNVDTGILAYAPKYASGFYGPFREAVNSTLQGDRASYQQDATRPVGEALAEVAADVAEGADMVMVKPALPYLDVLSRRRAGQPGAGRRVPDQRGVRDGRSRGRATAGSTATGSSTRPSPRSSAPARRWY